MDSWLGDNVEFLLDKQSTHQGVEFLTMERGTNNDRLAGRMAGDTLNETVEEKQAVCHQSSLTTTSSEPRFLDVSKGDQRVERETEAEGKNPEDALESFVRKLVCDIIAGAVNNLRMQQKYCQRETCDTDASTERTEEFCPVDARPTLVIETKHKVDASGSAKPNPPPKRSKRKSRQKRKLAKELAKLKPARFKNGKFLTAFEEEPTIDVFEDSNVVCPICLDVFYNAYTCNPCEHTFCEPCLRRLAKYCSNAGRNTNCPICREPIHHCLKNYNLTEAVREAYPHDYRRRGYTDANSKYMAHPLPAQPTQTVDAAIISHILRRRQQERQRARNPLAGYTPVRINFRRYISLAAFFVVIKALALMVIVAVYNAVLVE